MNGTAYRSLSVVVVVTPAFVQYGVRFVAVIIFRLGGGSWSLHLDIGFAFWLAFIKFFHCFHGYDSAKTQRLGISVRGVTLNSFSSPEWDTGVRIRIRQMADHQFHVCMHVHQTGNQLTSLDYEMDPMR